MSSNRFTTSLNATGLDAAALEDADLVMNGDFITIQEDRQMGSLDRTIDLKGASGTTYRFDVYTSDTNWREGVACVYYVSKRDSAGTHTHIYVGETEDMKNRHLDHHKQECFDRKGCNAISILMESNATKRLKIEADLVDALDPPCNG